MADMFGEALGNPEFDQDSVKLIEADNDKEYYAGIKKKNKDYLIDGLSALEKERIASHIIALYNEVKEDHDKNIIKKHNEYDDIFRMVKTPVPGTTENNPTYRTPVSAVATEVIHANYMNVFFTPKDIMRVLPTEQNDIPKVNKISTFGNWSMDNEMDIFSNCDKLFHSSTKNGECCYMVHWLKIYGTEFKREMLMNPADTSKPLYDPDTKEPLYQEVEEQKLLYNGPKLEVFSRKDYFQPKNALMDELPDWEARMIRMSYDKFLRNEMSGTFYDGSAKEIMGWEDDKSDEGSTLDYQDQTIPVGKWNEKFLLWCGNLRVNLIKEDREDEAIQEEELEDEMIAIVHIESQTLVQLRKNKFPLKMRPFGVDYFMPDDEGRRAGLGTVELLKSMQDGYDALFNQFIKGTVQANSPIVFFTPFGNQRNEKIKLEAGLGYPTADAKSAQIFQFPAPDASIGMALELINQWVQLLFGISDYTAGVESKIDPGAPAKKAQIVVDQGNVRMNMIIKRKVRTLQDIFKRWFLLYKENMPSNKFMRIAGTGEDPWKFDGVSLGDFSLNSLPDFELTGNISNVNKALEANKRLAIFNQFSQSFFFQPQSPDGLKALHALTKWTLDGMDEIGISRFLPEVPGQEVFTPQEENARFLQGDLGEPSIQENHPQHIEEHNKILIDQSVLPLIKRNIAEHVQKHFQLWQQQLQQMVMLNEARAQQGRAPGNVPQAGRAPQEFSADGSGLEGLDTGITV